MRDLHGVTCNVQIFLLQKNTNKFMFKKKKDFFQFYRIHFQKLSLHDIIFGQSASITKSIR